MIDRNLRDDGEKAAREVKLLLLGKKQLNMSGRPETVLVHCYNITGQSPQNTVRLPLTVTAKTLTESLTERLYRRVYRPLFSNYH